jgi:hypothetical protein
MLPLFTLIGMRFKLFVHAGDDTKTGVLKKLPGADTRLLLFEADIYNSNSFESAIRGCQYAFLVATPMLHNANSTQVL